MKRSSYLPYYGSEYFPSQGSLDCGAQRLREAVTRELSPRARCLEIEWTEGYGLCALVEDKSTGFIAAYRLDAVGKLVFAYAVNY